MTDLFDPNATRKRLEESLAPIAEQREETRTSMETNLGRIQEVNKQYFKATEKIFDKYDAEFQETDEIMGQLNVIAASPLLNAFKGLFDENFDRNYQAQRLAKQNRDLQRLDNQHQRASRQREMLVGMAAQEIDASKSLFEFTQQGFVNTAQMALLGIKLDEQVNSQQIRAIERQDQETLERWIKGDRSDVPKELQGLTDGSLRGLVQTQLLSKKAQALNVRMSSASTLIQESNARDTLRRDAMRSLTTPDLLAIEKGTRPVPEKMELEDVIKERQRREEQVVALESAKTALAAGQFDLSNKQRAMYMSRASMEELMEPLKIAVEAGQNRVTIQGLEFTTQELTQAVSAKQAAALEAKRINDERLIDAASTEMQDTQINLGLDPILKELHPTLDVRGMNTTAKMSALPNDMLKELGPAYQEMQMAKALGNPDLLLEKSAELQTKIAGYQTQILERTNEPQRDAKEEWMQTGKVRDIGNTTKALTDLGNNPHTLDHDELYGTAFQAFSSEYSALRGSKTTMFQLTNPDGSFQTEQTVTKLTDDAAVARAMQSSKAREIIVDTAVEQVLVDTLNDMSEQYNTRPDGSGESLFAGLTVGNSRLADGMYLYDEGGNRSLSYGQISDVLAAKTMQLRSLGLMADSMSAHDIAIERLRRDLPGALQPSTFEAEVFSNMAFPNDGHQNAAMLRIGELQAREDVSTQAVIQQQTNLGTQSAFLEEASARLQLNEVERARFIKQQEEVNQPSQFQRLINSILSK